jgi:hypothetical protein
MTMFKVYWTEDFDKPYSTTLDDLASALRACETLRKRGFRFVTMVSEDTGNIGKPGVDSVQDGKTPDGVAYTWTKRR